MADKIIKLNKEQLEAAKHSTGPLLIIAGAGTGKTTVITERIKHLISSGLAKPSEILALTFTDKAAREMEERVDIALPYGYTQMWISTFHAFCDRVLRNEAVHIGLSSGYKLMTEAESILFLRKNLFKFNLTYFRPLGNPTKFLGGMLQHFSRLKDEDVSLEQYLRYVQEIRNSKHELRNKKLQPQKAREKTESTEITREEIEKTLELAQAYKIYEELKVKEGVVDFADLISNALKLFRTRTNVLRQYQDQFKYILVDEFQDTNIAQYSLLKILAPPKDKPNLTVVGDDSQCLPPETKISTPQGEKRVDRIEPGDKVLTAIGKGHTSLSEVTRVFKRKDKVRLLTFTLEDGKKVTTTSNHKMFCYTPSVMNEGDRHFVYLMSQQNLGWRLGITNDLATRLRVEYHADKIIGIGSYQTEGEARYYEAFYAAKFGLPTVPFTPRQRQAISGSLLTRLFSEIDTEAAAQNLARLLRLELDSPHFMVGGVKRGMIDRVKINLQMCYRNYRSKTHKNGFVGNPGITHLVWVETSSPEAINKLQKAGIPLTAAKKGARFRFANTDLRKVWEMAERLVEITGGILDKKFAVGTTNHQHKVSRIVPASHVLVGSYLPVVVGKKVLYRGVIKREETEKEMEVYDLEVAKTHNFIANGVVVHNSIYKFRGAAVSNILQFMDEHRGAKQVILTKNYRSTQTILDHAYRLIKHNDPDTLEAKLGISKNLKKMRQVSEEKVEFLFANRVEDEADLVAKKVATLKAEKNTESTEYQWKDFAILVRANSHADAFVRALARAGIPYQFLGPGMLFRQPEVKDLIAYLKVLYNFEDSVSLYRVLSQDHFALPVRDLVALNNFSKKTNMSLFEVCEIASGHSNYSENRSVPQNLRPAVSVESKEKITKIVEMIHRHLKLMSKETAGQILYYFLEDTGLLRKLTEYKTPQDERRAQNTARFFDKLKTFEVEHEDATVPAVVDWIEMSLELGESPQASDMDWTEINAVNILTAHSAKGLEFPVVFLVNLVSQRFPTTERREQIPIPQDLIKEILPEGDYHLEEERRLFYVGMTRARDRLYLTAANYYGEAKRERKISPFVFEALGDIAMKQSNNEVTKAQLSLLEWQKSPEPEIGSLPVKIDYLSYSQIETFSQCPLHYKLKFILRIPTPPMAAQSFGTSLHAALRDFYRAKIAGEKVGEKELLSMLEKNWLNEGYSSRRHEELTYQKGQKFLRSFWQQVKNYQILPLTLEQPFSFPLGKLRVVGRLDRVDSLDNGKIEIIDYKTGANVPDQKKVDQDLQMTIYALAANQIPESPFGKKPEEVFLSLYYFESGAKITTTRTGEQLEVAKKEILEWAEKISKSDFHCSASEFCRHCEYRLLCEAG